MSDFREYKAAFLEQNDLKHYGVKGMKWGVINENDNRTRHPRYQSNSNRDNKKENAVMWKKYANRTDYESSSDYKMYNDVFKLARKLMANGQLSKYQLADIAPFIGSYGDPNNRVVAGVNVSSDTFAFKNKEDRYKCRDILSRLIRIDADNNYNKEAADRKAKAEAAKAHLQNKKKKR